MRHLDATCDARCSADALVLFSKPRFGDLTFCGHHATDNEALLILGGWTIAADGRPQLATREATR